MLRDELADARVDHLAVLAPAEDAVVADTLRLEVLLVLRGDALGESVGGFGLAVAGDVVELALDGEERRVADELEAHALAGDDELDDISGNGQTEAAQGLTKAIAAKDKQHFEAKGVGHYGIFSGRKYRELIYPRIKDFIARHA